jgi:prepilin signal peptidase PulO-like enzyme (type II secretory pathway)
MILGLYDAKYKLLPNKVLFPVIALAGVYFLIFNFWSDSVNLFDIVIKFALSLLPIAGLYGLLYLVGEKTGRHLVGFGDVKLGVAIAFLLPWDGAFIVLFLANVVGTIFALVLVATRHKKMNSLIPFGPFLLAATVLVFLLQINLENTMSFMYNIY